MSINANKACTIKLNLSHSNSDTLATRLMCTLKAGDLFKVSTQSAQETSKCVVPCVKSRQFSPRAVKCSELSRICVNARPGGLQSASLYFISHTKIRIDTVNINGKNFVEEVIQGTGQLKTHSCGAFASYIKITSQ
jgi:hypothetical protein